MNYFFTYVILLFLGALIISSAVIFILTKLRSNGGFKKKNSVITFGNVSILFDKEANVTIIPYCTDEKKVGRAISSPKLLKFPYKPDQLGKAVRYSMSLCREGIGCNDNELMSKLGNNSWKEFSLGKRNISVHCDKDKGVVLNSTSRRSDGSYQLNVKGYEKILANDVSDRELGESLLQILKRCRD